MGTLLKMTSCFGRPFVTALGFSKTFSQPALLSPLLWSSKIQFMDTTRNYAARKGTRERKEKMYRANKAKKKAQQQAQDTMPPHLRKAMLKKMNTGRIESKLPDDSSKPLPQDNVWLMEMYRRPVLTVQEAVANFQESHHPSILDMPTASIKAWIEMDVSTKKKNAFANAQGVLLYPHVFDRGTVNRVCAFCKSHEQVEASLKAGAHSAVLSVAGVKMFQEGKLDDEDYEYFVSHLDAIADLSPLRGVLDAKYPTLKKGNVGLDLPKLVQKFMNGVEYSLKRDISLNSFGVINVVVGQVSMNADDVEENFKALIVDVMKQKPKNSTSAFITKAMLTCDGTSETFEVGVESYLQQISSPDAKAEQENQGGEDEGEERVAVSG